MQLNNQGLLNNIDLEAIFGSFIDFEDIASVVSFILSLVPGGVVYNKFFNQFCKIKKRYKQKKHTADKYLSTFTKQKGSIYEEDGYTKLIREAIKWMGEDHYTGGYKWKGKKPVLIIEDLDRLDPKHLFRILNVISAHMEDRHTPDKIGNKFGFNNIVLVMDYDVTKHIFHHFYGSGACYEGYMSKFLSREPFRYSIQQEMVKEIEEKLANVIGIPNTLVIFNSLRKVLAQCTIRDLQKIAQLDTNHYIKSSKCSIRSDFTDDVGVTLSTSFPIFHLFVYMIESGITKKEIGQAFIDFERNIITNNITHVTEYLKLMYPIYRTMYPSSLPIKVDNKHYIFHPVETNQMQTDVTVKISSKVFILRYIRTLLDDRVGKVTLDFLDKISPSINLSALRSGNN